MATIKRFEEIHAWKKARELVKEIYRLCETEPLKKDYGLKEQLRRSAVSAMSNIAEGFARKTNREFAYFLDVAKGSATEVQSLLYVALDVSYIDQADFDQLYQLAEETNAMVIVFANYLRQSPSK